MFEDVMAPSADIILFGMPRDIRSFIESFERNVLAPLTSLNVTSRVSGQLNLPQYVENPRSGEAGRIFLAETISQRFPNVSLRHQSDEDIAEDLAFYQRFPDRWKDDYKSLRNLLHQQNSLLAGANDALRSSAGLYVFLRPDLIYLDSLLPVFTTALACPSPAVFTPAWLTCRGLNDRIAITTSVHSARIYSARIAFGRNFVAEFGKGLHSERLLAYTLGMHRLPNRFFEPRAARCRIDGTVVSEDFTIKWRVKARTQARLRLAPRSYAN